MISNDLRSYERCAFLFLDAHVLFIIRICTEILESPKFRETFRSVSVKVFAKFRIITKVSDADYFAKFWSFSAISVGEFFKTSQ